jgi:hypothetical protein
VNLVERRRCSGPSRETSRDGGHVRLIALRPCEPRAITSFPCGPAIRAPRKTRGATVVFQRALIDEAPVIRRILRHLHVPTEIRASHPTRAPALDVARAALSSVEGRPSPSRAVPRATAGTRSGSTRAADRRRVWPVCTHEMDASFRDSRSRRSARSRLHRRPARRGSPPPPCIRWTMLPEGSE